MDSFTFICDYPDFSIQIIPCGTILQASKAKLAENSGTFRDMFGILDDDPSTSSSAAGHTCPELNAKLEVVEDPKAFAIFLAVLHGWSAFTAPNEPRAWDCDGGDLRLMFDGDALNEDERATSNSRPSSPVSTTIEAPPVEALPPTASGTPRLPNDIPVSLLGLVLRLFDKYDASQSCYYIASRHLILQVETDALQVFTLANDYNMYPIAGIASKYLLSPDVEHLTHQAVQKLFPTALSYHRLVELQSKRRNQLRLILLDTAKWLIDNMSSSGICSNQPLFPSACLLSSLLLETASGTIRSDSNVVTMAKSAVSPPRCCGCEPCMRQSGMAIERIERHQAQLDIKPWSLFRMW